MSLKENSFNNYDQKYTKMFKMINVHIQKVNGQSLFFGLFVCLFFESISDLIVTTLLSNTL